MKLRRLFVVVLVLILSTPIVLNCSLQSISKAQIIPDVYIGIDLAYGDVNTAKALINQVSPYTNLFIIGCTAITNYTSKLDETCQYLYDKDMAFIVYQEVPLGLSWRNFTASNWTETAKNRWGEKFLGFYYHDEWGGRQLDMASWSSIRVASDYENMSNMYDSTIGYYTNWFRSGYSNWTNVSLFMSDYALYWFDYKAGYDTIFAEFGWNYSRQLNAALCRGAANVQNKNWGVIITWTYTEPPYIESGYELYNDLVLAYNNGAKYIVVFDSDKNYTQSILTEEHLDALERFWAYVQEEPREDNIVETRTAVVLPDNYAYGFRGPEDKIWGLWEADNISYALSVGINNLLERYGTKLDIIYDDELEAGNTYGYNNLIYWNDTNKFPSVTPTSNPTSTSNQNSSPTQSTTSTEGTFDPNPEVTATQGPLSNQDIQDDQNNLIGYLYVLSAVIIIVGTLTIVTVLKKRSYF